MKATASAAVGAEGTDASRLLPCQFLALAVMLIGSAVFGVVLARMTDLITALDAAGKHASAARDTPPPHALTSCTSQRHPRPRPNVGRAPLLMRCGVRKWARVR